MPYIKQIHRNNLNPYVSNALDYIQDLPKQKQKGCLNYMICKLLIDFFDLKYPEYNNLNDAIGVLDCAKMELYCRLHNDYELLKKEENGDMF